MPEYVLDIPQPSNVTCTNLHIKQFILMKQLKHLLNVINRFKASKILTSTSTI